MQKEIRQLDELRKKSKSMRLAAEAWKNDYEILVSTILSARTRDETTIPVSEGLFKKYSSPEKLSKAKLSEVQNVIRKVNFYKNKSKNIIECSKSLVKMFSGKIPHDFDKLITLPGIGRKTANVFLSEIGQNEIGVDTHVAYISKKLGWTGHINPEKIEYDLKNLFPEEYWGKVNSTLVRFGKSHTSRREKDILLEEIKEIK